MRRLVGAEQPDGVGQIGRAHLGIALAVDAVADRAILVEELCALRRRFARRAVSPWCAPDRRRWRSAWRRAIRRDRRPAWSRCASALSGVPAHAMLDRAANVGELAAPQPFVVIEIGIALCALRAGAMAAGAIVGEGRRAQRARGAEQLRRSLSISSSDALASRASTGPRISAARRSPASPLCANASRERPAFRRSASAAPDRRRNSRSTRRSSHRRCTTHQRGSGVSSSSMPSHSWPVVGVLLCGSMRIARSRTCPSTCLQSSRSGVCGRPSKRLRDCDGQKA